MKKKKTFQILKKLFPITRSITGNGILKSLKILQKHEKKIKIIKIKSGSKVFDWKVPNEWNFKNAYISYNGKKIIDTKNSNLHVVNFSQSINKKIKFLELKKKLFFLKKNPKAIPYKTTYYKKDWGFCLSYDQYNKIKNFKGNFDVRINTKFTKGFLRYGEFYKKGKTNKEVIFSTYLCHPSMANNELSGPLVCLNLIKFVNSLDNKYSYRVLFLPETIGSISFIKKNLHNLKRTVLCGFIVTCVGDKGKFSYIPSRYGNTYADKIVKENLNNFKKYTFLDRGSDERQFCSPLVNLPFCSVTRSKYREYPEYHTSSDNLSFLSFKALKESFVFYKKCINKIESETVPVGKFFCEPFLQKRNLYNKNKNLWIPKLSKQIIDYLSYADGTNNLKHISKILNLKINLINKITKILIKQKIIDIY